MDAGARLMFSQWIERLRVAVNDDNRTRATCGQSRTLQTLRDAPIALTEHAQLAIADLEAGGPSPLAQLRSDNIVERLRIRSGPHGINLIVARMTVPGGPWPGHFGLEAVIFSASDAQMPTWFPPMTGLQPLHLADTLMMSDGFSKGHGTVLFPELLATRNMPQRQRFGVVFIDRLVNAYAMRVRPLVIELRISSSLNSSSLPLRAIRQIAFLAHEWGHYSGHVPYQDVIAARRRRDWAVISELHADLAALVMLLRQPHPMAAPAAEILILDRVLRDAWLPRAEAQVNGVAARYLLLILESIGCLVQVTNGVQIRLHDALDVVSEQLTQVQFVDESRVDDFAEKAELYFVRHGWQPSSQGSHQVPMPDGSLAKQWERLLAS
jgi:hypothetical protein